MITIKLINGKFYICSYDVKIGDYVFGGQREYLITTELNDDEIPLVVAPAHINGVGSLEHAKEFKSFKIVHEIDSVYYRDIEHKINTFQDSNSIEIIRADGVKTWVSLCELKFKKDL